MFSFLFKVVFKPLVWLIKLPFKLVMLPFTIVGFIQKVMMTLMLLGFLALIGVVVWLVLRSGGGS